jgi:glucose-6-phosphate dehydrogenase assembly protein OpcA
VAAAVTTLWDTTGGEVVKAISAERRANGVVATGLVLTLVAVVGEKGARDALDAATEAAQAHPCRILVLVRRAPDASTPRLDAEINLGGRSGPSEAILLRMEGRLALHAESVVLPLLAPDTPVLTWWSGEPPQRTAHDPLGALASRRVTDVAAAADPLAALVARANDHHAGDTDLAWTRLTPWRSVLAGALDASDFRVVGAEVEADPGNPSAVLLGVWLAQRLGVTAEVRNSRGPGITAARLLTEAGPVSVDRPSGTQAVLSRPDQPDRGLPLARRSVTDLLAEELRRLGDDELYAETLAGVPAFLAGPHAGAA